MKSYLIIILSLLISVTSFSQSTNRKNAVKKSKFIPLKINVGSSVDQPSIIKKSGKISAILIEPNTNSSKPTIYNQNNPLLNLANPFAISAPTSVSNSVISVDNGNTSNNVATTTVTNSNGSVIVNSNKIIKDPRNLPLDKDGDLISVDGHKITFEIPANSKASNICYTPVPVMKDGNKNAACGFNVPCDNPANRDAANIATIKYFQLRWLVFTDGGPGTNIDQARVTALTAELNVDYAPHNIVFCADPATFLESSTWYTHNISADEFPMKDANNVTPTQVINIYVVGTMSAGGYARYPYDPNGGTSNRGGIVLNRSNSFVGSHTVAHEMGHVFGLAHTFAGVDEVSSCSNCYERTRNINGSSNLSGVPTPLGGPYTTEGDQEGDWCSDTNPHDTYSFQCSTSGNPVDPSCDNFPWANAPVDNIMSYSSCPVIFTAQQGRRQHCMIDQYLTSWTSYGGGVCGTLPPVAEFIGTPTVWVAPNIVAFTDLSLPSAIITSWTWVFDVGATGTVTCTGCTGANATFVGQTPPVVTYPNVGLYDVSLTITSANGPDTETKIGYIEVVSPGGDCDTLDTDWLTPTPTVTSYLGGFGYFTGVPCEGSAAPVDPAGFYQQYFTPTPGSSVVGAATVALGRLSDPNDNMTFQISVYEDDAGNPGFPDIGAGPLEVRAFSPTQVGVPTGAFYTVFTVPFTCAPTITGTTFHIGVEMFPGDATDTLVLMTNQQGEGLAPGTNTYLTTFCDAPGMGDYNVAGQMCGFVALDFDLYAYPQMGWYRPTGLALGYTENVKCDTTEVAIFTSTLYDGAGCVAPSGPNPGMVGWTYVFADGTTISSPVEVPTLNRIYTTAGPDTLTIMVINDCGRADTTVWIIPYNFTPTPDAEFTKVQANPICFGPPGVDFNANVSGYQDYTWDFGDGTGLFSTNSPSINHIYAAPGLYFTELIVTSLGYQPIDTFYLEDFESGWPAGYDRYNNDAFTPNAGVNPPFTGTDATAWLVLDADGDGSSEATSTSWNGPGEQGDDWMLTTGIGVLPANQMLTWDAEAGDPTFADGYEVRISTTQLPANTTNYSTLLMTVAAENSFRTNRSVDLSSYAGQTVFIAFRNNSTDEFLLYIDNIRVGTTGPGCSALLNKDDFVEIINCTVLPPIANLLATDSTGCAPLTITYTDGTTLGDPATTWLWNFGDGQFSTLQNPPPHLYASAGTYFVSFQTCNAGGCTTEYLTVVLGTGIIANAGPDQTICGGTIATFAGNDPTPDAGLWALLSGSGVPSAPTVFNSGVTGLVTGVNEFTWTITGAGCVSVDTVAITIVVPPNSGTNTTLSVCSTDGTTDLFPLLGGADLGGAWTPAMVSGTGVFDPAVDPAGVYTYTVTGVAPCANAASTVTVTINTTPVADAPANVIACDSYTLPALTVGNYFT
ncbi:MAG: hypothetical protein COA97_11115, partial [Flavobacteriales bacterium]